MGVMAEDHANLTDEEKAITAFVEKDKGRKLTAQEVFISLEQARALGEL